jgi:hypothetical protein
MVEFILIFLLSMSSLHLIKESFRFGIALKNEEKYESDNIRTLITFIAISLVISIIKVL